MAGGDAMNTPTLTDPLVDKEVHIHLTVLPGHESPDERQIVLSLGVAEQLPTFIEGTLAELPDLVEQAWRLFGAERPLAQPSVKPTPVDPTIPPKPTNLTLF